MEEKYKLEIRRNYYIFSVRINYLSDVYDYAEKYRLQRHTELSGLIVENTYGEFIEKHGPATWREFCSIDLWYSYTLIHSLFISAYSAFENQMTSIVLILEHNIPSRITHRDISKTGSDIDRLRKYLDLVHNLNNANISKFEWLQIEKFREIRNLLVHHGGRLVLKKRQENSDFLALYKTVIDPDTFEFYIREVRFLRDFIVRIKNYCMDLVKEIAPVPPSESF